MSTASFGERLELGVSAHQAGRLDEALAHYRAALSLDPNDAEVLSLSGLAMSQLGQAQDALPALQRAVELEPTQVGLRMNLVEGLIQATDQERALQNLRIILETAPGNARALLRYRALNSEMLIERRDWPALSANAAAWIQVQPASPDAWRVAARAAFEQGRHVEACNAFAHAMTLSEPTVIDHTAYAGLCLHALDFNSAAAALDRAEALDADYAPMLTKRALLLMYLGRFEESERYARRCLERDPGNVPAYTTLSHLKRGQLPDADLAAVTQLMQEPDVPLDYRIPAAFATAQILEARNDIDAAFAAYQRAHALAIERDEQEHRRYDREQVARRVDRITGLSLALPQQPAAAPRTQPRPIFIVGMPRSGTTLVESVLAAHSRVVACGERPAMPQILRALLSLGDASALPDPQTLQQWTAAYFAGVPSRQEADHLTDKHPLNFEAVGLVARLFPEAVILHVRRDPVETCLSIFRQEFNKHWAFAHRLADIGHYYCYHENLIARWHRELPGRIATVQYEELAANFQATARRLVESCGLDWEPGCLEFQRFQRPIATFSSVQARDPVVPAAGRAQRYRQHLAPLVQALECAGWSSPPNP